MKNFKEFMEEMDSEDSRTSVAKRRFSTPQDMGNAACFLCSDEASMITGTVLEVDGGRCI